MNSKAHYYLSGAQQAALVILRTLIGWHFLYEGYYKLILPAWSADGKPLPPWTSAGYLKAASGPLARVFQWMIGAGHISWIDNTVRISLLLIGLSLILGLLTRVGLCGALFFLALFYLLAIPAVGVLLVFNTGAIAGLDMFLARWKSARQIPDRVASIPAFEEERRINSPS